MNKSSEGMTKKRRKYRKKGKKTGVFFYWLYMGEGARTQKSYIHSILKVSLFTM
jgi:hypothetical protein